MSTHTDALSLARDVSALAGGFDHVVIDVGGEDDMLLSAALSIADELVAPVAPSRRFDQQRHGQFLVTPTLSDLAEIRVHYRTPSVESFGHALRAVYGEPDRQASPRSC